MGSLSEAGLVNLNSVLLYSGPSAGVPGADPALKDRQGRSALSTPPPKRRALNS